MLNAVDAHRIAADTQRILFGGRDANSQLSDLDYILKQIEDRIYLEAYLNKSFKAQMYLSTSYRSYFDKILKILKDASYMASIYEHESGRGYRLDISWEDVKI